MFAIERILCPVDSSECSRRALEYAVGMARCYGARVTALHVFANTPVVVPAPAGLQNAMAVSLRDADRTAVAAAVDRFVAQVPSSGVTLDVRVVEAFDAGSAIVEHGESLNADLVVMGTHGRTGVDRLLLGSTAGRVVRTSHRPVMLVPPHAREHPAVTPFKRLLCPVDFSESSLHAVEWALHLAEETGGSVTLLHAIELPPELDDLPLASEGDVRKIRAAAAEHSRRWLDQLVPTEVRTCCSITTRVVEGTAHDEILKRAAVDRSDLIVMGVRGRRAIDVAVFGSNTNAVLHGAGCPVLTVRT